MSGLGVAECSNWAESISITAMMLGFLFFVAYLVVKHR